MASPELRVPVPVDLNALHSELQNHANPEKAVGMSAYMRNQFAYYGVPSPIVKEIAKRLLPRNTHAADLDWAFVDAAWAAPQRELQYLAMKYLDLNKKHLGPQDLPRLKKLVEDKSWWDSIDTITHLVGDITLRYPEAKQTILAWSQDPNFWVRRTAIEHQLGHKTRTDTQLLTQTILNNLGSKEFFINKAIGWVLRDYSKTDPAWVRAFIEEHRPKLSALSIREGGKYC